MFSLSESSDNAWLFSKLRRYKSYAFGKPFLGTFAKLRKATVSLAMSVCPSPDGTTRLLLDGFL
jgi:hypothetical protein